MSQELTNTEAWSAFNHHIRCLNTSVISQQFEFRSIHPRVHAASPTHQQILSEMNEQSTDTRPKRFKYLVKNMRRTMRQEQELKVKEKKLRADRNWQKVRDFIYQSSYKDSMLNFQEKYNNVICEKLLGSDVQEIKRIRNDLYQKYGILKNRRVTIRDIRPSREVARRLKPVLTMFKRCRIRPLSGSDGTNHYRRHADDHTAHRLERPRSSPATHSLSGRPCSSADSPTRRCYSTGRQVVCTGNSAVPDSERKRPIRWCISTRITEDFGL